MRLSRFATALSLATTALPMLAPAAHASPAEGAPTCLSSDGKLLPLIERPAAQGDGPLVLLLTGDGGWANADQKVAEGLTARGASVVGLNMRAYLGTRRTPDETARDLACVAYHYLGAWNRERVILLGYSRGADIVPFVAARWPEKLRSKLSMVALVSMSPTANFQFHLIDLLRDVKRDDDLPVAPEIGGLRGIPAICVYGDDDKDTGCTQVDTAIVKPYVRSGGHRLTGGFDAIVELLAPALGAPAGVKR